MRLLHVTPYYAPAWAYGGVVRAVTGLTRIQAAAGHRVVVLTTDTLDAARRLPSGDDVVDGVRVVRLRNRSNALRGRLNLSTPVGLRSTARRLIREHGMDLVHCHELRTVETLRVTGVATGLGLPLVVSPHGTLTYRTGRRLAKRAWDRLFGPRLLRRFDQVIALTDAEADEARALWARRGVSLRDDQLCVVPNGVDANEFARVAPGGPFRAQWGLGDGPIVISVGRLTERKGLALLIRALADVRRHVPEARLVLVGPDDGAGPRLRAQVEASGVTESVTFTGLLTGADRIAALAAADVFALPAVGEGFSVAVLEAMACGLPVVLSPDCHFPEAEAAGAAVVVPRDVRPLAEALRGLLTDGEARASLGRRARELVCRCYTWRSIAARLETVYEAAIRRHAQRQRPS
jgi:glycosyltransferase involved in cell wall biosynthesis